MNLKKSLNFLINLNYKNMMIDKSQFKNYQSKKISLSLVKNNS